MPITRFIWDCLPLEKIIVSKSGFKFPKVIDYACGAGHFLTEGIEAINEFFQCHGKAKRIDNNAWVEHSIFGVEKDYRLARVAKVSLYMNGAGLGNIKFGDGLESYPEEEIKNGSFDILVANPPYSVSGFKMHLKVKDDAFELLKSNLISNDASEIETLFVERISQLLKPCGIAAVILPSSILSNESGSYIGAREILLQNFYLRGVTQFGGKTFGATNTVVLFLEKYDEPPKKKEIIKDTVDAILSGKIEDDWNDKEIFKAYLEKINVEEGLYKSFVSETISEDELKSNEYFAQYVEWLEKDKSQKKKSNQRDLLKVIKEKEREKLFYFSLIYNQTTVVVSAPADNNEQKKFLGYDWSNRKGQEGIQIVQPGGMLYNDRNRYADNTLAAALQSSFSEKNMFLSEDLEKYCAVLRTQDMIGFSRVTFNKVVKLIADRKIEMTSKYPLITFSSIISTLETGSRPAGGVDLIEEGVLSLGGEHIDNSSGYLNLSSPKYVPHDFYDLAIKGKLKKDDLLICKDGALTGKVALVRKELDGKEAMINEHIFIVRCQNTTTQFYLFDFLYSELGQRLLKANVTGSAQGGLSSSNLKNIKIPLPPLNIQQQIVSECEKTDEKYKEAEHQIVSLKNKIYQVFDNIQGLTKKLREICIAINPSKTDIRNIPDETIVSFVEMASVSNDGFIENSIDKPLGDLRKGSYTYFAENDIIIAKITPCMENGKCAIARNLTNQIGMGSSEFHVFRIGESCLTKYVFAYLNRDPIRLLAEKNMTGASGHRRVPVEFYENLHIPVPQLSEQKQIVSKIEQYEEQIAQAKVIMAECPAKKKAILKKYLER